MRSLGRRELVVWAAAALATVLVVPFAAARVGAGPAPGEITTPDGIIILVDGDDNVTAVLDPDRRVITPLENYRRLVEASQRMDRIVLTNHRQRSAINDAAHAIAAAEARLDALEAPPAPAETGMEPHHVKTRAGLMHEAETIAAAGAEIFAALRAADLAHERGLHTGMLPPCDDRSQSRHLDKAAGGGSALERVVVATGHYVKHQPVGSLAAHKAWVAYVGSQIEAMKAVFDRTYSYIHWANYPANAECALAILRGDQVVPTTTTTVPGG